MANKAYKKPYEELKKAVVTYLANTTDATALAALLSLLNAKTE